MSRSGFILLGCRLAARIRPTTLVQLRPAAAAAATAPSLGLRSFTSSPVSYSSTHQQATLSSTCPSCGATLPTQISPLCPSCSALLPPPHPSTSSFTLFNLPQAYALDSGDLKRTFLQLQQKVHPDRFGGMGEQEGWAREWSSRVNEGYKVLGEGRSRGEYLVRFAPGPFLPASPRRAQRRTDPEPNFE
jgi:molecular chaperone HscB